MNETILWDDPLNRPTEEFVDKDWVKHVHCDGARWHVLWWTTNGTHCSEPRCIINKRETPLEIDDNTYNNMGTNQR